MWLPVSLTVLAGWLCVFGAFVSAQSENIVYKKEGDEVVLKPGSISVPVPITSIIWRDGPNIASQWDNSDSEITNYRHFKGRVSLNISSGEMTIKGLTRSDTELYTPEINSLKAAPTRLIIISPVPVPTVTKACDDANTSCTLTCEGNTTAVELVTYIWKSDDKELTASSKEHHVTKEDSSSIKEFSCELKNPVSLESSKPIPNPFITTPPEGGLKINAGLTVFICLLTVVVVVALIHRWKAGMWFFQKDSMPWEADFWRNHKKPRTNVPETNGTTVPQEQQEDEETPIA
ncbi:carcinoembryonic antigen-related cell adhesion molecule 1-like [Toxotes jaculatrix]|uniref:carcinoembryonic antigen-related cell adhesion molecule 1-like n=1 Tax=Toxotes jaculatrix TaxID=941984 RepID=UPI001B3ACF50|nr:carcinoembryonic antigen-related cell adhesion molecule 1-like [Toxotes jaculatrix]